MLLTDKKNPSRLGVFFFFDPDGVVDDYVTELLSGFENHFSDLVIVCNGELSDEGRQKLESFSKKIIVRENKGFDVWAYKTALDTYGWDKLVTFDEVILFNSTIMGPVYPFSEMFESMDKRDLDFWGITKFHKVPNDPFGRSEWTYLPEHIQSHFHAYRKSLVSSQAFQEYWDNIPPINDYFDAVGLHEAPFTKRFADKGFKWAVYADSSDLEGYTYGPVTFAAKQLIGEKRCPIFKRRSFFDDYHNVLVQSVGNSALDLYEYLQDSTDFNTDLIWQNALRTMHLSDLVKNLHLDYVLPTVAQNGSVTGKKIALVIHLYYMDLLEKTIHYIRSMPEGSDIIMTVGSEENAAIVRDRTKDLPYNCDVRIIQNRGRDVSALLVGVGKDVFKYDYVCFAHDKKVTQLKPYSIGQGFADKCFENILASKGYVQNILRQFEGNPRLGMMMPNPPNHADYFNTFAYGWGPNYQGTQEFLDSIGIDVPLNGMKECIAPLGTMFWFRPEALRGLLDHGWRYEDFPPEPNDIDGTLLHYIERSYSYVAQSNGFYSAFVFSDKYARIEITNLAFETRELTKATSDPWARSTLEGTRQAVLHGKSIRAAVKFFVLRHIRGNDTLLKLGKKTMSIYHALRAKMR